MQAIHITSQKFQRLAHLDRGNDADYRHDYAGRITSGSAGSGRRFGKNASQAGRDSGTNSHRHAIRADRRTIDPIHVVFHTSVVNQVTSRKIVRAVKHEVAFLNQTLNIGMIHVYDFGINLNVRIDFANVSGAGNSLGQALPGISFGKHRLPLEI